MCASGETRSATASCATMGRSVAVVATLALNVVINDVPATCPAARFQVRCCARTSAARRVSMLSGTRRAARRTRSSKTAAGGRAASAAKPSARYWSRPESREPCASAKPPPSSTITCGARRCRSLNPSSSAPCYYHSKVPSRGGPPAPARAPARAPAPLTGPATQRTSHGNLPNASAPSMRSPGPAPPPAAPLGTRR
jgi:hypothetical protein